MWICQFCYWSTLQLVDSKWWWLGWCWLHPRYDLFRRHMWHVLPLTPTFSELRIYDCLRCLWLFHYLQSVLDMSNARCFWRWVWSAISSISWTFKKKFDNRQQERNWIRTLDCSCLKMREWTHCFVYIQDSCHFVSRGTGNANQCAYSICLL